MAPIWRQAIAACDSVIGRLDKTGLAHQRPFVIGLTLAAVAIFIAAPDYRRFQPYAGAPWAAAAIEWKFSHPLQPIPVEEFAKDAQPGDSGVIEHLEKRSYRIAVPFISNALHIGITGALIGQQFASYLFLIFAALVARRVIPDALCGLLVGLLFATSFIGQWGFNDFVYFDGLAYLAIMLMLWAKPPIIVLLAAFIGPLIDERVALTIPIVYVYLLIERSDGKFSLQLLLHLSRAQQYLVAGAVAFLICRIIIGYSWGKMADTSGIGAYILKTNLLVFPLTLVTAIKGATIVLALAAFCASLQRNYVCLVVVALASAPILCATFLAYDITRSLAYAFPLFYLAMFAIKPWVCTRDLRRVLTIAIVCGLPLPTYVVVFGKIGTLLPIVRFL